MILMSTAPHSRRVQPVASTARVVTREDLKALADFRDESGHAVTFYFKPGGGANAARDAKLVQLESRNVISNAFATGFRKSGLLRDLDEVLQISENAEESEAKMKVVFACRERGLWLEYDVPTEGRHVRLHVGNHFDLAPLLRALDSPDERMQ